MHELGVAQEMLKIAFDYANKNQAKRITAFNIAMSVAADESEDSLRFHFENLMRGTMAEGAKIDIERVPVQAHCLDCGNEFALESLDPRCVKCGSARVRPQVTDEFKLTSIDVE
jgi:hydrogenase nickel incorporation protein HypA/HybF